MNNQMVIIDHSIAKGIGKPRTTATTQIGILLAIFVMTTHVLQITKKPRYIPPTVTKRLKMNSTVCSLVDDALYHVQGEKT